MNSNIFNIQSLQPPNILKYKYQISEKDYNFVLETRNNIKNIIDKKNDKLVVIMGPCSIHDEKSAIEYAKFLKIQRENYKDNLEIVMRTYFSKPRTTLGWKGLIYDPDLNNTYNLQKGMELSRKILININSLGVPTSMEHVDTIFPQYFDDIITWSAIGARSVESQVHRELASGISTPLGFKNNTNGDIDVAVNAIETANKSHNFVGCDELGNIAKIITTGNNYCNIILRGGKEPNYSENIVKESIKKLKERKLNSSIIIDFSHGNSKKIFKNQLKVCEDVSEQIKKNKDIIGVMVESNLVEGNQKISNNMIYGQSITDGCINLEDSKIILEQLNEAVKIRRALNL